MPRAKIISTAIALAIAAAIIVTTSFAASWVEHSRIYRQSRLLGAITGTEGVSILGIVTDPGKRDVTVKFIAALTSAYINFELIPYNEAQTFAAVFQSLSVGIYIDSFEYRRHDLMIRGFAGSMEDYNNFISSLAATQHFASVTGHANPILHGGISFEIWCSAAQSSPVALI